ncbi:mucin-12-like isoform X2 [Dreissena polymorpha]|uniref:mucin-12-like isoform X2 n=1 Tax=Dreissena polymorpha TaxID=45954 RepID=UPI0022654983|nr:mucin-12-like isoform X2 [Dreissena polymorpha]
MDLRMKLDTLIAERDQRDTSKVSQQPTFHPMDTQRGRGDTGLGIQQTTFHPLDAKRDQRDKSIGSQQPTFHPMDTQRGRGDTDLGGQQTTFYPLDAQRDQADTWLYIQQTTFHPDVTPTTLENRNTHALLNPVDTIHLTEFVECDGASCDQIHSSVVTCKTTTPGTSATTQTTTLRSPATTQKTTLGTPANTQTTMLGTPATTQTTTMGTPAIKQTTTMGKLLNNSTPNTQTTELLAPPTKHIVIPTHLNTHPASTQGISTLTHSTQPGVDTTVMPSSSSTTRRITTPLAPGHFSLLQVATQCAVGMEPTYPSSAGGYHERPRTYGDPVGNASRDQTSVSSAELKSEQTDGGLETENISVSWSPSPQSFQGASSQPRDTSMSNFSSSSDFKHSSGSESEDHKPNGLSEKSRGDSPTVSSTVTASHQDSRASPPAQRKLYHHPSVGAAPVGFDFRYTTRMST